MRTICLVFAGLALLTGCQTGSDVVPLIAAEAAQRSGQSAGTLREGRALFVNRCIECHALPIVSRHRAEEWPALVTKMSARADLKPAETDAITAYLVTLRRLQR
jgi:mono/diheme cytochrome c family protein